MDVNCVNSNSNLNLNARESFLFHLSHPKEIGRVVSVALPFIAMYTPAAPLLQVHKVTVLLLDIRLAWDKGEKNSLKPIAFKISLVAISILFPSGYLFFELSYGLISQLKKLKKEFSKKHLLEAIYCSANLLLFVKPNKPELLMVSYLVQGLQKALLTLKNYNKSLYLEVVANSALSLIKLYSFHYYAELSYRNRYGKDVTQADLDALIESLKMSEPLIVENKPFEPIINKEGVVLPPLDEVVALPAREEVLVSPPQLEQGTSFAEGIMQLIRDFKDPVSRLMRKLKSPNSLDGQFKKFNYKGIIKNLTLNGNSFKDLYFKDLTFSNTTFKNVSVIECLFSRVVMDQCNFSNFSFKDSAFIFSTFTHSRFQNSRFKEATFFECTFKNTHFMEVDARGSLFHGSSFEDFSFVLSDLQEAGFDFTSWKNSHISESHLEEAVFFGAKVENSTISSSNLKNTLLFDAKDKFTYVDSHHEMSKRVVGLLYDFDGVGYYTKKIHEAAKKMDAVVFRIFAVPIEVYEDDLKIEMILLSRYKNFKKQPNHQFLIERGKGGELGKIKDVAEKVMPFLDGLILPGGGDHIPEAFYKKNSGFYTSGENCSRALMEMHLLDQAKKMQVPTLGICRGNQAVNVAHGGTLKDVKHHWNAKHLLTIDPNLDEETALKVETIIQGKQILAHSMHFQAIDLLGSGLTVGLWDEGTPELILSQEKVPLFVGTQFHPEYYQWGGAEYSQSKALFDNLKDRIEYYHKAKK